MKKPTQSLSLLLSAGLIAGLSACGDAEVAAPGESLSALTTQVDLAVDHLAFRNRVIGGPSLAGEQIIGAGVGLTGLLSLRATGATDPVPARARITARSSGLSITPPVQTLDVTATDDTTSLFRLSFVCQEQGTQELVVEAQVTPAGPDVIDGNPDNDQGRLTVPIRCAVGPMGDFDGDGKLDVSWLVSNSAPLAYYLGWQVHLSGTGAWRPLMLADAYGQYGGVGSLATGDFDGDGKDDLFWATGQEWLVSYGATGPWTHVQTSAMARADLAFGDFNGDGKTDVFRATGSKWLVSYGATAAWSELQSATEWGDSLAFGDFNGDGKTDVFQATGSKWLVSYGAIAPLMPIQTSATLVPALAFGDFNGDGKTDVFRATGSKWLVSYGASSPWSELRDAPQRLPGLVLGDFDGDGRTDIKPVMDFSRPPASLRAAVLFQGEPLRPDVAGWRRERLPTLPDEPLLQVIPDWICDSDQAERSGRVGCRPRQRPRRRTRPPWPEAAGPWRAAGPCASVRRYGPLVQWRYRPVPVPFCFAEKVQFLFD